MYTIFKKINYKMYIILKQMVKLANKRKLSKEREETCLKKKKKIKINLLYNKS